MELPIALEDVLEASERVAPHVPPSPVRSYPEIDRFAGTRVLVKHENLNPTGSFKVRNGVSAMTALSAEQRARGVVAATRGNHGLGVSFAGAMLGVNVKICVPVGTTRRRTAQ